MIRSLAFIATLLATGCAHKVCPDQQIKIVKLSPPAVLLNGCPAPLPPEQLTALSAAGFIVDLRKSLSGCNADKQALRQFYAQ